MGSAENVNAYDVERARLLAAQDASKATYREILRRSADEIEALRLELSDVSGLYHELTAEVAACPINAVTADLVAALARVERVRALADELEAQGRGQRPPTSEWAISNPHIDAAQRIRLILNALVDLGGKASNE